MRSRRAAVIAAAALVAWPAGPAGAAVSETTTEPYPGVTHTVRVDDALPTRAHIVAIDLSSQELHLVATAEDERGRTVSDWAGLVGAQVALNGDLFEPLAFAPAGLAFGGGAAWSLSADTETEGLLVFDRAGDENHARIEPPETLVLAGDLGPEVEGAVGGRPMLVRAGVAGSSFDCADALTLPCERAPRSAVGLSEDGRTLLLVVVDGWQADSAGMTTVETAALLLAYGAHDALAFDPGSSATLVVTGEGGVVSAPSDGAERTVANHLGVRYGSLPPGTMVGMIRERDIFDGPLLPGATVVLDDGASTVANLEARYTFSGLTPRWTCATASLAGYHPATSCRMVPSADTVWNSIALYPNSDFIDAGPPPPDGPPRPDAAVAPDAEVADAGPAVDGGGVDADGPPDPRGTCDCHLPGRGGAGPARHLGACLAAAIQAILLGLTRRKRA